MKDPEISTLIKNDINALGCLHLDPNKTTALIRWIENTEKYLANIDKSINILKELTEPFIKKD